MYNASGSDFANSVVAAIRDIKISSIIRGHTLRFIKSGGAAGTISAARVLCRTSQSSDHPTRGDFADSVVVSIRDIDVSRTVHRHAGRVKELRGCPCAISMTEAATRESPHHTVWRDFTDGLVIGIGDINI